MRVPLRRPAVGAMPPELELPSMDGSGRRSLAALRGKPVLVSFLGPSYCMFCRAHVVQTVRHREDFTRLGAEVIMVAYHDPELVMTNLIRELELPYTLLIDSSRDTYRRWGLDRASLRAWIAPGFYWQALIKVMHGEPRMPETPDPVQMGADFVINRDGRLSFVHYMKSFHDRAKVPVLLSALASV